MSWFLIGGRKYACIEEECHPKKKGETLREGTPPGRGRPSWLDDQQRWVFCQSRREFSEKRRVGPALHPSAKKNPRWLRPQGKTLFITLPGPKGATDADAPKRRPKSRDFHSRRVDGVYLKNHLRRGVLTSGHATKEGARRHWNSPRAA